MKIALGLRRWYWPLRSRFHCIYHSRLPASPPPPAAARELLILSVGHVAMRKGQLTLVQAFARIAAAHPGWNLALIGHAAEPDCMAQIEQTIAVHQLGGRVQVLGSRNDTAEFMRRAGIVVQPSLFEGLPLALQEAMFYGCACIATRVTGNDELVHDGRTGLLVPPADPAALAQALDRLIRDPAQRATLGRAATAFVGTGDDGRENGPAPSRTL
jgi:glycosyltransferase involved in cell wall biosynthesis